MSLLIPWIRALNAVGPRTAPATRSSALAHLPQAERVEVALGRGSGELVDELAWLGLIDEYRFIIYPSWAEADRSAVQIIPDDLQLPPRHRRIGHQQGDQQSLDCLVREAEDVEVTLGQGEVGDDRERGVADQCPSGAPPMLATRGRAVVERLRRLPCSQVPCRRARAVAAGTLIPASARAAASASSTTDIGGRGVAGPAVR